MLVGLTLTTTRTEIYRALFEALVFGTKTVLDTPRHGASASRLVMTGGLAELNPLLLQLMADICDRDVEVPAVQPASARGAALHTAVASRVSGISAKPWVVTAQRAFNATPLESR